MATSFYLKNNSSADNYPFLELQNNNSNNKSGEIRFIKNKDTTASNDSLGIIKFEGYDSSTTQKEFAQIKAIRVDDLILSEDGGFIFSIMKAGVMTESMVLYEGNLGLGTSTPGTLIELESFEPYITLKSNDTNYSDGAKMSKIIFEDYLSNSLGQIQVSHDGTTDDTKGDLIFSTNDGTSIYEGMRINSNQNVGIGQIAPTHKLDITGTVRITSDTTINGPLTLNNNATITGDLVVDSTTLYVDSTNNCIGIRTSADSSYPLLVSGTSRFIETGTNADNFVTYLTSDTEGGLNSNIGGVYRLVWDKDSSSNASYPNSNYNVEVHMRQNGGTSVRSVGRFENDTAQTTQINFTGQHRCLANQNLNISNQGKIVVSSGNYINIDNTIISNVTESLPIVELCSQNNDKKVFGVISSEEDSNVNRTYGIGFLKTIKQKTNNNEQRLHINSVGEGGIWVCNKNGQLENGDYITSTDVVGYGAKQTTNEGILTNYTVAKITCDCDFSLTKIVKQKLKVIETTDGEDTTRTIDYDTNGNYQYEDDLDENNSQQMIYPLETRFLDSSGNELVDEDEYNTRLANSESVYIACFVGCTYHCG